MVSLHILMPATEVAAAVGKWKMEVRELFCFYSHGGSGFPRLGALIWESFWRSAHESVASLGVVKKNALLTAGLRHR